MDITKEIIKIFTDWTKLKIRIHISKRDAEREVYFKERQIWWASLGQNIGVEVNGKNEKFERPVLVVKVFNTQSCLVAPISSKVNTGKYLFEFINNSGEKNVVNLSQLRTVSSKRFVRKVGEMANSDFENIIKMLKEFL